MNHENKSSRKGSRQYFLNNRILTLALSIIFLVLLVFQTGLAQENQPSRPRNEDAFQTALDDGGTAEVGIEWITDWPGTADDRANWYHSANGLSNELLDQGWIRRFFWGNTNAWERDFKRAALGGIEQSMIDSVDLGFIGTHGSSSWDSFWSKSLSSVYFSSNNDDWHLVPGDAYRSLGNNDLEWLAFDSCSVLRDDSKAYWYSTFDGLHLMAGFANTMYVVYPGDGGAWGDQMRQKGWWIFGHGAKTVTQAWFSATDDQQPSGVRARVLAEVLDNYNDYIWGQGYVSPDPTYNGYYWWWDHVSGTPQPLPIQEVPDTLPILILDPPQVDEEYVKNIGLAFGLDSEILAAPDRSAFYMVGGDEDEKQVRVDALSGGFYYQDLGELWTDPERPRSLPQSPEEAYRLGLSFLAQHDNLPGVFEFDDSISPTVELEEVVEGADPEQVVKRPLESNAMNYAISFMRTVDLGDMKLSIVGPGSRQNVYLGDESQVIGLKGGWRPFMVDESQDPVPVLSSEKAWEMFLADPSIAVAETPKADDYKLSEEIAPTLAYYEQPTSQSQAQLIPVWIFTADLFVEAPAAERSASELQPLATEAKIYVPAADSETAMMVAEIKSPENGLVLKPGETIELAGSVEGGLAPYTFSWDSSVDGDLGSGEMLSDVALSPDVRSSSLNLNQVKLTVRDANGKTATATVDVMVLTSSYLPVTIR
ncbi:MAG: DUF6345 domain-containing protein [Candidatus Promineifilaceae bacterium]|jgi:hypothetical protein